VRGVVPEGPVTVVQLAWHGDAAATLTFRDDHGRVSDQLIYRDNEPQLSVDAPGAAFAFDGDGRLFRLVSEALRIRLAYLFDPLLAVHTSNLEPLPHQISAVYGELLPRQPLRFLLADDPGAGKTIMAGLFIKELIVRGDLRRCLIVCPGSLVEQWQDELWNKLHLDFDIITRETIENSKSGNPYAEKNLVISRLDHMSRNEDLQAKLAQTDWDLVVVDEAHKMSAHFFGNEIKETKRYKLGKLLASLTRHLLLMTATPHSGNEADFQLFMALLDADRFEGRFRDGVHTTDSAGMMRRLVKENLLKFNGKPLFPERRAYSPQYELSDEEAYLYKEVTDYVREEMNRAERLAAEGEGRRGTIVGFALTILQRRLASSPEAIYQSLQRRRKRLEDRVREEELRKRGGQVKIDTLSHLGDIDVEDIEDFDDRPETELEELEEEVVDQASAAQTIEELKAEIVTLTRLEEMARKVRNSGNDRKWEELSSLLQNEPEMFEAGGSRRKMIIFTEHRDTMNYLTDRLRTLLGRPEAVVNIHGGMARDARRKSQEFFTQDKDVHLLVATDAAGEGINLQRAHLLVNYDLPWNPNRIEQRFGRIHRIGQTEVCHMWNLVSKETREGDVFTRLFEKLEQQRASLGGQVFDVLGQAFSERSLRDLLIEAVRYGERPEVKAKLDEVVDHVIDENLKVILSERALVSDVMGPADVERIREQMEEAEARKLQPHFVRSFFLEAFKLLGGHISERESERYEITHVPADVRNRDRLIGIGAPVLRRYERVTFEKELISPKGQPLAQFLCPGHPLLDSTVDLIVERYRDLLKKGAVLVAPADESESLRVLLYLENAVQSARTNREGNRLVVSKRLQFIEIDESDDGHVAGYAPYLDYRPITEDELKLVEPLLNADWLKEDVEARAFDYAIQHAVPEHLHEVRRQTLDRLDRTMVAVNERLTKEINYWDHRANELKQKELAGKQPKMNSGKARQRADELQGRLKKRIEELEQEKQLSPLPPVVIGGAAVIPQGLIDRLRGERSLDPQAYAKLTERVERAAVDAVLKYETGLGREPIEMHHNNPGFDIRSKDFRTGEILFIEVKGRVQGAPIVTVTKNEILTALNKPEQFIFAMVEVADDNGTIVRYLRRPFTTNAESLFDVTSVNYKWKNLFERAGQPT
jgi:SNF2 family DNA or RNA helicase